MGIRCDQVMGLNEWAQGFVRGEPVLAYTEEVTRVYPDGRRETLEPKPLYQSSAGKEESGESFAGMFGDCYPLHKYTLPFGVVYFEKVQEEVWSAGPVFFLALQDERGEWVPDSLWPASAIENA